MEVTKLQIRNKKGYEQTMKLSELKAGCTGTVTENTFGTQMRRRMCDLGFVSGCKIECVGESIFGNPRAYLIKGSVFALRNSDADNIFCM